MKDTTRVALSKRSLLASIHIIWYGNRAEKESQ